MKYPVVISCEHAGSVIPADFQHLFSHAHEVLSTHRGWDIGALPVALDLARALEVPLFYEETSRLLIEMNRSLENPALFSEFSSPLDPAVQRHLIEEIYLPYRNRVLHALKACIAQNQQVLHLSMHTFTPVLEQEVRTTDIGLLFDPGRKEEVKFCQHLQQYLLAHLSGKHVDFNVPYQGTDDGFTTFLRKHFAADHYAGIEIEINQKFAGCKEISKITEFLSGGICNFFSDQ